MDKNLDYIAYLYAQDEKLGVKQIKDNTYPLDRDISSTRDYMDKNNIKYMVYEESSYHTKLLTVPTKPYILYYIGDISLLDKPLLGIVGPRSMSLYGQQVLDTLFAQLTGLDVVSISGGADGVDTYAHTLSMKNNIPTIVVLGGGIGCYLKSGKYSFLKKVIAAGGLIISDFKLYCTPQHYTFPQRNRLIAGLSTMLFVPEAREDSGSLITVDFANKVGVPTYAAMQDIFVQTSVGSNTYIEQGLIKPVHNIKSILDKYFPRLYTDMQTPEEINQPCEPIMKVQGLFATENPHLEGKDLLVQQSLKELGL